MGQRQRYALWASARGVEGLGTNLGLGGGSDTRDGESDVDSGAHTLKEELGLEEDLSVAVGQ